MSSTSTPARRPALWLVGGAVVLVAVLIAFGAMRLRANGTGDGADASDQTQTPSASPTASAPATTDAAPSAWPSDVSEADLMTSLGKVSAVWLAIWPDEGATPPLPSEAELAERGYEPSSIRVACLDGSVEQLGLDPMTDFWGLPLYFSTAEDAQAFTELWGQPVEGITEASIACDWG